MSSPNPATTEWVPIWNPVSEGPAGPPGPPGPPGLSTSVFYYKADATSTAENDPGAGKMRWNTIPQTNATYLYLDRLTDDGFDIIALLQQTHFGSHFIIQDANLSSNSQTWEQLGPGVVMGGDWFEVPVMFVSQSGTGIMANNQRVAVLLDTEIGPHAHTHETGGTDPLTVLDASILTTGTLAPARLPANVALQDAANTFTHPNVFADMTTGVVTAVGLGTTPLNASQLTTGTVPDVRLSANVQMKPIGLGDLPATVATKPIPESDVTNLVTDLAARVTGPASALNNGIAIWSGTTGKILKDSAIQFANVAIKNAANTWTAANDFTGGSITAPTAAPGTNTTQVATTAFVVAAVTTGTTGLGNVTGPASAVANNLASFSDTTGKVIADSTVPISAVARKDQANTFTAGVTFQVGPTAPTATAGTSTTQVATTAFVVNAIATSTATPAAHHASHETGGTDALVALSAAILTTGVLPDARLSANVAMVNTANTFTFSQTFQRNANVGLFLVETGALANAKIWEVMSAGSIFTIYPLDDSYSSLNAGFQITRAGDVTTVGKVTAPGGLGTTPLNADNLTSGTVPDARLSVNVLKYTGGYPGGTTTWLRADGTWSVPSSVAAAHHATHEPGGTDAIVGAAWLAQANVFTVGGQEIVAAGAGGPVFRLRNLTAPANSRAWHFNLDSVGTLYFVPINDDNSTAGTTYATIARTGDLTLQGNLLVTKTRPEVQVQYAGDTFKNRLASVVANAGVWLTTNMSYDGTNWNLDDTSKPGGFFALQSNTLVYRSVVAGVNPVSAALITRFNIDATGLTTFSGQVQVSAINPGLKFGGATASFPALRAGNTQTNVLEVVTADTPSSLFAAVRALNFIAMSTGNNFGDLTVTGGFSVGAATLLSGELDCVGGTGTAFSTAPIEIRTTLTPRIAFHWPGVVASQLGMDSAGVIRTYDNPGTGYAAFACTSVYAAGVGNSFGDLTCRGATNFQGGISVSAGGGSITGTLTVNAVTINTGGLVINSYTSGSIQTSWVIYPGQITNGALQASWYLASHSSYGLYSNTGLYLAGSFWVAAACALSDVAVSGLLTAGRRFTFRNITSTTYNAVLGDFVLCQGNCTVVLPPPSVDGGVIDVKVYGGAPGTVTVLCASYAYYIDYPAVQYIMTVPNQSVTCVCGVSQWFVR